MDTYGQNFEIRDIPLTIGSYRKKVERFLQDNDLKLEQTDYYAGVFIVGDDEILGGGGLEENVMKCIAISDRLRDTGLGARLISHLYNTALNRGYHNIRVFTKPKNLEIFTSLSFKLLAKSDKVIVLESGKGLEHYCNYLKSLCVEGNNAAIVMNANPFTIGHRYLVEQAAKQADNLYIVVVKEDRSLFSYQEREAMIRKGVEDIDNVTVCKGSDYAISGITFPSYFLKQEQEATDSQIAIDTDLFANYIAPCLSVKKRFVGTEPEDGLTRRYNELMKNILPKHNIELVEVKRKENDSEIVSASLLRNHLENSDFPSACKLSYKTTIPYLLSFLACKAIKAELDTTPKPGLVDKNDSGAHKDMDYSLMCGTIEVLHKYFTRLSLLGMESKETQTEKIREIGLEAEKAMFEQTKGVNTYKGALFSMGIVLYCSARVFSKHNRIEQGRLQECIVSVASGFCQPLDTHGKKVLENNGCVKGALACATEGYRDLFNNWLPYFSNIKDEEYALHKLLLRIMTSLDDTNIYYRKGPETVEMVKQRAKDVLDDFSLAGVSKMNKEFVSLNISPGGAADMLSLTLFCNAVIERENK